MKCNNKMCSNRGNPIRSAELQSIAISGMTYGIDIIAHAGELRFYDHLTLDEIIEKFSKLGFKFGLGEMSFIINKFLALLAGVQEEKIPEIRKTLEKKGFVLSVDGTISIK
jgi:tRNA G10  N-methylase Trm11